MVIPPLNFNGGKSAAEATGGLFDATSGGMFGDFNIQYGGIGGATGGAGLGGVATWVILAGVIFWLVKRKS